ncbi:uncharacterized protein LOC143253278 isoform X2 [Tachypleus tridentatus]|uniref:uncharacterized protein LOC143253278 isoform X2 n=1 Tax=Tachypleus tridentatus TaxID=6853 RepID=UPI003FD2E98C
MSMKECKTARMGNTSTVKTARMGNTSTVKTTRMGNTSTVKTARMGNTSTVKTARMGNTSTVETARMGNTSTVETARMGNTSTVETARMGNTSTVKTARMGNTSTVETARMGNTSTVKTARMGNTSTSSCGRSPSPRSLEKRTEAREVRGRLPRIQPISRTRSQVVETRTIREIHTQQLSELGGKNNCKRPDMIPEPDYNDSEEDKERKIRQPRSRSRSTSGIQYDKEGFILPRKPANPCLESSERQSLHRELLFNQRIGRSVLNQKTELQKALEKFKDEQKKMEIEEKIHTKCTASEKKLKQQAIKINMKMVKKPRRKMIQNI